VPCSLPIIYRILTFYSRANYTSLRCTRGSCPGGSDLSLLLSLTAAGVAVVGVVGVVTGEEVAAIEIDSHGRSFTSRVPVARFTREIGSTVLPQIPFSKAIENSEKSLPFSLVEFG
jgi:hypothetical protein